MRLHWNGIVIALLCGALSVSAAPATASATPEAVVRAALDDALAVLRDDTLDPPARRRALEQIAFSQFDMPVMAVLVIGRPWRGFEPVQREAFLQEFQRELSRNYGGRLERYSQESVEIVGVRDEPRGDVTVLTRVVGGSFGGAELQFRLRRRETRWLGIDVVIEGVSLVSSYRAQFQEILGRDGVDGLIERLRSRNERE